MKNIKIEEKECASWEIIQDEKLTSSAADMASSQFFKYRRKGFILVLAVLASLLPTVLEASSSSSSSNGNNDPDENAVKNAAVEGSV